ncbi:MULTISPECIES: hypothetical protein [unclassified Mesorhizobium]|uniref:hypothetical protein n=1 Tax=unclassified Mesorhizobium TaxID=325217 RepID=UPI000FCA2EA1|nr:MULTISPECIES: hypothetical protein [unclassified Mesorhizobium]RUV11584.1 hypothetical protein EOA91_29615 [Mesorhizobium sp. M1A.F.Ca.IN.022.04.1.1]RWG26262.1 MAG: hypothetical protein EOQ60_27870 [Mesorhizobium sp.]
MGDYSFDVPRARTRDIFRFFVEAGRIIEAPSFSITEIGAQGATLVSIADGASLAIEGLTDSQLYSVYQASMSAGNISITLTRLPNDPLTDRLNLTNNEGQKRFSMEKVRQINEMISNTFLPDWEPVVGLFHEQKAFSTLMKSHQQMLVQLQGATVSIAEQLVAARLALETEFEQQKALLQADHKARQEELNQAAQAAEKEMASREAALLDRSKVLDDRDHIHARRKLREDITKGIEERLASAIVPVRTSRIGWAVFGISIAVAVFLGWISFESLVGYVAMVQDAGKQPTVAPAIQFSTEQQWFLLVRGAVTGVLSVAFLVYAIGWLKSIYHADVRAQRDLERYSIDLNRASWAVETIMEAKKDGGSIPEILVAGVARNLFDGGVGKDQNSQSDGLGSLLRASAKAKITTNGAEFEVNSRGARRLANELDGEN